MPRTCTSAEPAPDVSETAPSAAPTAALALTRTKTVAPLIVPPVPLKEPEVAKVTPPSVEISYLDGAVRLTASVRLLAVTVNDCGVEALPETAENPSRRAGLTLITGARALTCPLTETVLVAAPPPASVMSRAEIGPTGVASAMRT